MPKRRSSTSGSYRIGGVPERTWPTIGAAINVATRRAEQAEDEIQMGVFENDRQVYRVRREPDGTVTIEGIKR